MKKLKVESIKNIEFVYDEEDYEKVVKIPYDQIADLLLKVEFPEFCDYFDNRYCDNDGYYIYDHSDEKEYEIKYTGTLVISKNGLNIETIEHLTNIKELSKLSHIVINCNDNTRINYKNIIVVYDGEDISEYLSFFDDEDISKYLSIYNNENNYEYPLVYENEHMIHISFVYDCVTYKRVGAPNE